LAVFNAMLRLLSHAEQLAVHLREELLRGRWRGEMPGAAKLEAELGVNHTTISQALNLLEQEGILLSQGEKRRRRIVLPEGMMPPGMRLGIFLYEQADNRSADIVELRHRLLAEGFNVSIPAKTLTEMDMDVRKIARVARATEVDAWVLVSASSGILEWFGNQSTPAIAFAGRYPRGMKLASVAPGREKSMAELVRRLVSLGHRRIVFLTGSGTKPLYFINEMEAQGIAVGDYNMPAMERSPDGMRRCLDSLFALTPPTALIIDEPGVFLAVQDELARRGVFSPKHVSLSCMDYDTTFDWYRPTVAHISWEMEPIIRRIIGWATNVSRGKDDRRPTLTKSVFIDGGTIGPAPRDR